MHITTLRLDFPAITETEGLELVYISQTEITPGNYEKHSLEQLSLLHGIAASGFGQRGYNINDVVVGYKLLSEDEARLKMNEFGITGNFAVAEYYCKEGWRE